jgi:single-strand DNA-binding protein
MNQVLLTGRVATEPKQLGSKTPACCFRVAVKKITRNDTESKAEFFPVIAWAGLAEACQKYLTLGREISVNGRLRTRSYSKGNETRWITEIVADKVEFMGSKREPSTQMAAAN